MYYSIHSPRETAVISKKVQNRAYEVRNNRAATMAEMCILAKEFPSLRLKMSSIYIQPGTKDENGADQVGHAYLINDMGDKLQCTAESNDCWYMAASKILEIQGIKITVKELRKITAEAITSNSNFSMVMKAEKWIHENFPREAYSLLCSAGIKTQENSEKTLETEPEDFAYMDTVVYHARQSEEINYLFKVYYIMLYCKAC